MDCNLLTPDQADILNLLGFVVMAVSFLGVVHDLSVLWGKLVGRDD